MSNIKDVIKARITASNNKYNGQQQKSATVIKANQSENYCTIYLITRDGIPQVLYKVPVLYTQDSEGSVSWFPEDGDEVRVLENNKNYTITGPIINRPNVSTSFDSYTTGSDDQGGFLQ